MNTVVKSALIYIGGLAIMNSIWVISYMLWGGEALAISIVSVLAPLAIFLIAGFIYDPTGFVVHGHPRAKNANGEWIEPPR